MKRWIVPAALCAVLATASCADRPAEQPPAASDPSARTDPPPAHDMAMAPAAEAVAPAAIPSEKGEEIPAGDPVPTVALHDDGYANGTWSFSITTDLDLTMAAGRYQPMRGHIHVYVDGVERQMIAGRQFTLKDLAPGTHTVRIALASTTHRNFLHDGSLIADSRQIVVPPAPGQ
jgi:hypothetical protein